jgi:fatty acid desaturase
MTWRAMGGTPSASPDPAGSPDGQPQYAQSRYGQASYGQPQDRRPPDEENAGWSIFSYLIAGMVAYGLIGWLLAWLTHIPMLTAAGALVGLVFAIGGIVWKYGRHP